MGNQYQNIQNPALKNMQNMFSTYLYSKLPVELKEYSIFLSVAVLTMLVVTVFLMGLLIFAGTRAEPEKSKKSNKSKNKLLDRIRLRNNIDDRYGLSSPFDSESVESKFYGNRNGVYTRAFEGDINNRCQTISELSSPFLTINTEASLPSPANIFRNSFTSNNIISSPIPSNNNRIKSTSTKNKRKKSIEPKYAYIDFDDESCYESVTASSTSPIERDESYEDMASSETYSDSEDFISSSSLDEEDEVSADFDESSSDSYTDDGGFYERFLEYKKNKLDKKIAPISSSDEEEEEEEDELSMESDEDEDDKSKRSVDTMISYREMPKPNTRRKIIKPEKFSDLVFEGAGPGVPNA